MHYWNVRLSWAEELITEIRPLTYTHNIFFSVKFKNLSILSALWVTLAVCCFGEYSQISGVNHEDCVPVIPFWTLIDLSSSTTGSLISFMRLRNHHTSSAGPFRYLLHQTDHSVLSNPPQTHIPASPPPPQLTLLYSSRYEEGGGNNPRLLSWSDPRGCLCQKKEMTCQHHSYTNIKVQTGLIGQICEPAVFHNSQ